MMAGILFDQCHTVKSIIFFLLVLLGSGVTLPYTSRNTFVVMFQGG